MTGNKKQKDFLDVIKDSRPRWALIAGFLVLFVAIQTGSDSKQTLRQAQGRLPFS